MHSHPYSNVLYRKFQHHFPCIVRGEGIYLVDSEGKKYIDACSGAFVANLGHGNTAIAEAIRDQVAKLAYVNGTDFTHEPVEALAKALCDIAPEGLTRAFFLSGGTEVTEAAMKLARQYWLAKGKNAKYKIISRVPSYHGNTFGAMGVSGRQAYRVAFAQMFIEQPKIPPPICYRCPWGKAFPGCDYDCAQELQLAIQKEGPETVAAFIAEPILGSTGTAMVPPTEYYPRILEICRKNEVLFIADEILCGMGRTGDWFAISSYGVTPDILLAGKGLASGCIPLSAMLAREELIDALCQSNQNFLHASTFAHHPVACAAGLATINYMKKHNVIEICRELGEFMHEKLKELRSHPLVGDIRGRGLLAGIELVADKTTRKPFARELKIAERIKEIAIESGMVLWINTGHADGANGDAILLAPPFIVSKNQIYEILRLLQYTLDQTAREIKTAGRNIRG